MSVAVAFVTPPPGFSPHVDFVLTPVDGAEGLFALHAADQPGLRVFVVDPRTVLADYAPTLSDDQVEALALDESGDALLLVVAQSTEAGLRVNLMAPIVVNTRTGVAAQVILEDQGYPVRALVA